MRLKAIFKADDAFGVGAVVYVTRIEKCDSYSTISCTTTCNKYRYILEEDPAGANTGRCGWAVDIEEDSLDYILFHEKIS